MRSDDRISVHSREVTFNNITVIENVRYCNDTPECIEGAKEKSWIKRTSIEVVELDQRVPDVEPHLITRFKWRANLRCKILNTQREVPYYRWEVHDWLDGRWAVLAMQNQAIPMEEIRDVRGESGQHYSDYE